MTNPDAKGIVAVCQRVFDSLMVNGAMPDKRVYMSEVRTECTRLGIAHTKTIERQYGHRRDYHLARTMP